LGHQHFSFLKEYDNGKMDGFNLVQRALRRGKKIPAGTYPYRYTNPNQIKPYWSIAQQYVLADGMFTTQSSSSFTAHQDFIAGGTPVNGGNVIDFPNPATWGCNGKPGTTTNIIDPYGNYLRGKGPFPCFTYATMRDLLDGAGLSWLYFTNPYPSSFWNAFDAIAAVRNGPEWTTNIITPETNIFQYISNNQLPAVSWVIPDAPTSDHPGPHKDYGPDWVASVVNAIGQSSYWPSTVVIVVWDEWGGQYDNVPPPQLDGQGLGPRIPMLIVSAYDRMTSPSQPGYISHTQYEPGSILKFIEQNWNLGSLGTTDVRANSIVDSFDFTQQPRPFLPIQMQNPMYNEAYWRHYKPSTEPIDEY
jgi:phospholipase C